MCGYCVDVQGPGIDLAHERPSAAISGIEKKKPEPHTSLMPGSPILPEGEGFTGGMREQSAPGREGWEVEGSTQPPPHPVLGSFPVLCLSLNALI